MTDDRFDERLRQAAQDYHRPPVTPREELWHRVAAPRAARRRHVIVVRSTLRWGVGIAAVLALGVAIGRWSARRGESPSSPTVIAGSDQASTLAYRVAAAQYLTRTEALLTGFHAEARSPSVPAVQFSRQARDLLATTRLMLDSPAANDARLKGLLDALNALEGLNVLDALDAVGPWDSTLLQDEQDPTDSLWRAARRAFNRGDYASAGKLYADLARRYPGATRAGDALYWAAFALYKNDDLVRARSLLFTQQERYAKAATLRDGYALLARIQTALAKQGDSEAAAWLTEHAQPVEPARGCPDEDDEDDVRVAALNGLLQMDATNALPILKKVL